MHAQLVLPNYASLRGLDINQVTVRPECSPQHQKIYISADYIVGHLEQTTMTIPSSSIRFLLVIVFAFASLFIERCSAEEAHTDILEGKPLSTSEKVLVASGGLKKDGPQQMTRGVLRHDVVPHSATHRVLQNMKGGGEQEEDCTTFLSRDELTAAISRAGNTPSTTTHVILVCPGTIPSRGSPFNFDLNYPVAVVCSKPKACNISAESTYTGSFASIAGGNLSFEGMIVTNFRSSFFTASSAVLTFKKSEFHNNNNFFLLTAGVVDAASCTINVVSCVFRANSAAKGGAITQQQGGRLVVTDTIFESNQASSGSDGGGAIYLGTGVVATIEKTSFKSNQAGGGGGALYIEDATVNVNKGCVFEKNQASGSGGAIYVESGGTLTRLSKSKFKANKASSRDQCNNIFYEGTGQPTCGP